MVPDELLRGPTEQRFTKETHGSLFSSLILAEGMMACPFCDWLGWLYVFSESLDPSQGREGNRELSTQWWSCLGCCPKCWQIKHVKTAKTYLGPEPHSVNPPCGYPGQRLLPAFLQHILGYSPQKCLVSNTAASRFCLWDPTCPISGWHLMRTPMISFSGDSNFSFPHNQWSIAKHFIPTTIFSDLQLPGIEWDSGLNTQTPALLSASYLCCWDTVSGGSVHGCLVLYNWEEPWAVRVCRMKCSVIMDRKQREKSLRYYTSRHSPVTYILHLSFAFWNLSK